jgi:glycine cleavage system H protein
MVALFILAIIVGALAIEFVVGKRDGRQLVVSTTQSSTETVMPQVPSNTMFHRGHTWARMETDGTVRVGMDEFARTLAGAPEKVDLPGLGNHVSQGELGWSVQRGGRDIPMLSPLDGEIVSVNDSVTNDPGIVETSPYEDGWIIQIRPTNLNVDRRNLLSGRIARHWLDDAYERLAQYFNPELGAVLNDGGELACGVIDEIEADRYAEAVRMFFLAEFDADTEV